MMKKVLVVGSSMAMPRDEIKYEDTWVYLLKKRFADWDIIDKSRRASTTQRLVSEGGGTSGSPKGADLLEYYNPSIVITQIGITDCAPRLLGNNLFKKILDSLPSMIKGCVYRNLKKHKKRSLDNSLVSQEDFKKNWITYIKRTQKLKTALIIIKISEPTALVLKKSPKLAEAIEIYNLIIESFQVYDNVLVLSPFTNDEINKVAIDDFHVNSDGHDLLFRKLLSPIYEILD